MKTHLVKSHFRNGRPVRTHRRINRTPSKKIEIVRTPLGWRRRDMVNKLYLGTPSLVAVKRKVTK